LYQKQNTIYLLLAQLTNYDALLLDTVDDDVSRVVRCYKYWCFVYVNRMMGYDTLDGDLKNRIITTS